MPPMFQSEIEKNGAASVVPPLWGVPVYVLPVLASWAIARNRPPAILATLEVFSLDGHQRVIQNT